MLPCSPHRLVPRVHVLSLAPGSLIGVGRVLGFSKERCSGVRGGVRLPRPVMMRILIVEDEEHLARLVAEVLGREGYATEAVGDGRTALSRALVEHFDMLIVDWMLPDLDGVQIVKRLPGGRRRRPGVDAHGPFPDRGPGRGPGRGRRRLPPQALRLPRATRPRARPGAETAREEGRGDSPHRRRRHARSGPPRGEARRRTDRPHGEGVRPASHAHAAPRAGIHPVGVARHRLGRTTGSYTNSVDLYVHYLRKKLDREGEPSRIRTIHGTGYTFDPQPEF